MISCDDEISTEFDRFTFDLEISVNMADSMYIREFRRLSNSECCFVHTSTPRLGRRDHSLNAEVSIR